VPISALPRPDFDKLISQTDKIFPALFVFCIPALAQDRRIFFTQIGNDLLLGRSQAIVRAEFMPYQHVVLRKKYST